ncbi:hypothetical protein EMCRGX_G004929 [Ephydatia muelleri]
MADLRAVLVVATLLCAVSCCLGLPWVDPKAMEERIERDATDEDNYEVAYARTKQCDVTVNCISKINGITGYSTSPTTVPADDPDACNAIINGIRRELEKPRSDVTCVVTVTANCC